jgi:hypothetical protein
VEDDARIVHGTLVVNSTAQTNGGITLGDVISFSWSDSYESYTSVTTFFPNPLPISTMNAGFIDPFGGITAASGPLSVGINANNLWNIVGNNKWTEVNLAESVGDGAGHWTISQSPVPEPTSFSIGLIAVASCLSYALARS